MEDEPGSTAAEFDQEYSALLAGDAFKRLRAVGFPDLPAWLDSYSFVPASGLVAVAEHLRVEPGSTLLDVACGLGGPGRYIAEITRTTLVGVDFSPVAVQHAARPTRCDAHHGGAYQIVGSAKQLPIRTGLIDSAICIDSGWFISDPGLCEVGRVARAGASFVMTDWIKPTRDRDGVQLASLGDKLDRAGFDILEMERHDEWLVAQQAIYDEALRLARNGSIEPAVHLFAREAEEALPTLVDWERWLVVARRRARTRRN